MSSILTPEALLRKRDKKILLILVCDGNGVDFSVNHELLNRLSTFDRARIGAALEKVVKEDFKVSTP